MRGLRAPAPPPEGGGDPWAAFGYVVAGVALYGAIGWALGTWLHAMYLVPIGILLGAGLGLTLVFYHFGRVPAPPEQDQRRGSKETSGPGDQAGLKTDRGETE